MEAAKGHFVANNKSWMAPQIPQTRKMLSPDTQENHYVAKTIANMRSRLRRLSAQLSGVQSRERFTPWISFLEQADRRLRHFETQTFLGELRNHRGHIAPSLALHMTPGYREFFSSSLALESVLEVSGGPLELPEKDLATLYELWCFVALAGILRKELNLTLRKPSWLNVTQRRVALELVRGKQSVLSLEQDGVECIRVIYNNENRTPTGSCRPDNTLEVFKLGEVNPFRYVFDAKYRLNDDPEYVRAHFAPGPPVETIHRMHAYRDQIVHEQASERTTASAEATIWDLGYRRWVQQTVGAFVLYPYAGADAARNRFFESIDTVGVGGVPFLPSRREEVTRLLKRIIEMSTDAVEDNAIELSTVAERQRIEWAHEYGLIAIVPTKEQLDYILEHGTYHTPYTRHRRWGLRLRADFILFILSETSFPGQSGVAFEAEIASLHFGDRTEIIPTPPASSRGADDLDHYVWFKLREVKPVSPIRKYVKPMPKFAFTTRLALNESINVSELLLIREPERRFYRECRNRGFDVAVHDESIGSEQVFDVAQLRLRFTISVAGRKTLQVRFDPRTARFSGPNCSFSWTELMFRPETCLESFFDSNDQLR